MRKYRIFLLITLIVIPTISCCYFSPNLKKDSELITDFEPLEWSDDYVFGTTFYPPRISVWNSCDNRLIRHYDFFKSKSESELFNNNGRWLEIVTMQIIKKSIWCITTANQCSLVKIDIETGKITFIDLKKSYEQLEYIPEANNGKGAVLVVPYAQYKTDFQIKLFDLDGSLLATYNIQASDLDILTATGQYKNGAYYFCASTHKYVKTDETSDGIYKIIKLDLESYTNEVIELNKEKVIGKNFIKNNFPQLYDKEYLTSFSVKNRNSLSNSYMIAIDFINDDVGRFLFETDDLVSGNYIYTGSNIIYSNDNIKIFPCRYYKYDSQYIMIGNYGCDLYSIFFDNSVKETFFMPNAGIIFMDLKDDAVWCSKNAYSYSKELKKWEFEKEGIYKVNLKNKDVSLYFSDGTSIPVLQTH